MLQYALSIRDDFHKAMHAKTLQKGKEIGGEGG